MTVQVIVYSKASGRVRRVVDPQVVVPNVITFLNQVPVHGGELRMVYNKVGGVANDTIYAWQAAASLQSGLIPTPLHPDVQAYVLAKAAAASKTLTTVSDWYCVIDANNNILSGGYCDPAAGDSAPAGCTLVACPQLADSRWTYNGTTFTPPVVVTKV